MTGAQAPVTVVSGVPRSGTSLMMAMLGAGGLELLCDGHRPPDADNPNGYFEYAPVRATRSDASWLALAVGKAVKVIHALVPDLPAAYRYRVIFMHRSVHEVVASQRAMLERSGGRGAAVGPEELERIFTAQIDQTLARLHARADMAVLEVSYNALLREPERHVDQVARFLGPDVSTGPMTAMVDPRLYRQRAASWR